MKGILGKKIGMTQLWSQDGVLKVVTVIEAGPCPVVQVKNNERDGYSAVQIGYGASKEQKLTKPELGHQKAVFEKTGNHYSRLMEMRNFDAEKSVGDVLQVDMFAEGEMVNVRGVGKGKGFQGVVKRYGFKGGRMTHGSTFHRQPGSVGAGNDPGRIIKGKRMPGRMGGKTRTVKNLEIVQILPEKNLVLVKGSIPGNNGSEVFIYKK